MSKIISGLQIKLNANFIAYSIENSILTILCEDKQTIVVKHTDLKELDDKYDDYNVLDVRFIDTDQQVFPILNLHLEKIDAKMIEPIEDLIVHQAKYWNGYF